MNKTSQPFHLSLLENKTGQSAMSDVYKLFENRRKWQTTIPVIRRAIEEQEAENRPTIDHRKRVISAINVASMFYPLDCLSSSIITNDGK